VGQDLYPKPQAAWGPREDLRQGADAAGWSGTVMDVPMVMFREASGPTFQHLILR
jgi:hypothetical protein